MPWRHWKYNLELKLSVVKFAEQNVKLQSAVLHEWLLDGRGCGQRIHRRRENESPNSSHTRSPGAKKRGTSRIRSGWKTPSRCVSSSSACMRVQCRSCYVFLTNHISRPTCAVPLGEGPLIKAQHTPWWCVWTFINAILLSHSNQPSNHETVSVIKIHHYYVYIIIIYFYLMAQISRVVPKRSGAIAQNATLLNTN